MLCCAGHLDERYRRLMSVSMLRMTLGSFSRATAFESRPRNLLSCPIISVVFFRIFNLDGQQDVLELNIFIPNFNLRLFRDLEAELLVANIGDRRLEHFLHPTNMKPGLKCTPSL
jgi:hypothetical protein